MHIDEFMRFIQTMDGERLMTGVRRAVFRVDAIDVGVVITPESSGRPRVVERDRIERFLTEYRQSQSRRAGDYQDVTFDASYLLALLAEYELPGSNRAK